MKESGIKELLKKWQKRLNLQDWCIVIEINCKPSDFVNQNCCGECDWQEVNKTAVIRLLDPDCYGERVLPYDIEEVLVHELLHAKFCFIDNSGNVLQDRLLHSLIEELARAFVSKD